ncbi:DUF4367 domain-containing protein [Paenibacillus sp. FSL K6-1096]|uniref:DUF4367 domain-containing protein n=1 Tax=Paenibacillus sp. FSL K6-1096 TaxID=2921460 RepID=UPI0030EB64E7
MGKSELTQEERFLKEGDRSAGIPPVDVHDPVMQMLGIAGILPAEGEDTMLQTLPPREGTAKVMRKLEPQAAAGRSRRRFLGMPVQGWVAAALVLVMLGGGYTQFSGEAGRGAGAKAQYKVLPYKPIPATNSGHMIEKTKYPIIPSKNPSKVEPLSKEDDMYSLKYKKSINTLEKLLPPGEYATFLIERKDGKGTPGLGLYCPPIILKEYSVYKTSVEKYKAPELNKPEYLPNGYTLERAIVRPSFIKVDDNLKVTGVSKIDLGDNFQMRWRKEKPENITYESSLVYKKDKIQVRISASRVDEKAKPGESLLWTKTTKVENIEIDGKQLIYLETSANEEINLGFKNRLVWADPEAKIIYNMSVAQEKSELSKDEIIRIAASMMK